MRAPLSLLPMLLWRLNIWRSLAALLCNENVCERIRLVQPSGTHLLREIRELCLASLLGRRILLCLHRS